MKEDKINRGYYISNSLNENMQTSSSRNTQFDWVSSFDRVSSFSQICNFSNDTRKNLQWSEPHKQRELIR